MHVMKRPDKQTAKLFDALYQWSKAYQVSYTKARAIALAAMMDPIRMDQLLWTLDERELRLVEQYEKMLSKRDYEPHFSDSEVRRKDIDVYWYSTHKFLEDQPQ